MDHPEIVDFINWKVREEKKAHALIAAGYSIATSTARPTTRSAGRTRTTRPRDRRVHAAPRSTGGKWQTRCAHDRRGRARRSTRRTSGARSPRPRGAAPIPGVQYDTTINRWHTCPNTGRINASNPCSEYMFLDDTACNLSSVNLTKFLRDDGSFDVEGYRHACRVFFIAQEILVDLSSYPTQHDRARTSHDYRPLGPRLREPRHAAHAARHPVRQPTRGARSRRRSPRSCAATPTRRAPRWRRRRARSPASQEPRADAARDAHAPRRGVRDRPRQLPASRSGARRARTGTTPSASASSTATATRRRPCSRRRARSACSWTATRRASSRTSRS